MYKENQYLIGTTINEFLYLLQNTTAKLVFASSSSVYNGIQSPHNEKAILKVTDFYAETRMAMERLAELYHMLYLNKIIALRLFSVYGEHEQAKGKYANMVTQMLWKMQKHESPVLYGDGSQTRDFIWVGDVVKAFKLAMEKDIDYGVFNIGTGSSYSFNDVITLLNKELGEKFNPTYKENPIKNYVEHTLADMDKTWTQFPELRNTLPFKEGIKHLIKAYK
jgi:UDP-glucose 4-epimerase